MNNSNEDYVIVSRDTLQRMGIQRPEDLPSIEVQVEDHSRQQTTTLLALLVGGLLGFWIGGDCDL